MKHILLMSAVSTSGMTLFSLIISGVFNKNFNEAVLLNQLIYPNKKEKEKNNPAGFVVHYLAGLFFAVLYRLLWKRTSLKPGSGTSAAMGLGNGLAGITVWHAVIALHPDPPHISLRKYYLHLVIAHVVYGYLNGIMFRKRLKRD